jgi:hypothetical protein
MANFEGMTMFMALAYNNQVAALETIGFQR